MPGVRTMLITDARGTLLSCNRPELLGRNFSQREYFVAPARSPHPRTVYVSPPFETVLGVFTMNLTVMIPGPGGEFDGVVSASLDPGFFSTALASVLYAPDMWSAVAHGRGLMFLMVPERQGMPGLNLAQPGSFFSQDMESGLAESVLSGTVYATGEERILAQRTVRPARVPMDNPLVVAVGRDVKALYAPWRQKVLWPRPPFLPSSWWRWWWPWRCTSGASANSTCALPRTPPPCKPAPNASSWPPRPPGWGCGSTT